MTAPLSPTDNGSLASVVPTMPLLIAILSRGFVRVVLPSSASFSRIEVLLFFLGNGVLAFLSLSRLLGALYLPDELLQLSQQTLVGETERLHLIGIGV